MLDHIIILSSRFCEAPASVAPYVWPDDITKWPICRFVKKKGINKKIRGKTNQKMFGQTTSPSGQFAGLYLYNLIVSTQPGCIIVMVIIIIIGITLALYQTLE